MDRRSLAIQNALPILARAIARRLNVEVQIGGDGAWTDGKLIHLPALPFGKTDVEHSDVETLAFGYLEHEAAHVRYSDEVHTASALHHSLYNVIEDVRIEKCLGGEYPGFAVTLQDLIQLLVNNAALVAPAAEDSLVEKLTKYLLYRLRSQELHQDGVSEYAGVAESLFREAVSAGVATRVGSVIGRVSELNSSQDACDLSRELIDIFKEERDRCSPENNGPSPSCTDQQTHGALQQLLSSDGAPEVADVSGKAGEQLGEAARQAMHDAGGTAAGIGQASEPVTAVGDGQALLLEVHGATSALRTRLRSFVEASKRNRRSYSRRGARFDGRRAVKAQLGDPRVYRKKVLGTAVDTAAVLLVDRSGSMRSRIVVARQSTLAAAAAMEEIRGVNVCAAAFPGCHADVDVLTGFHETVAQTAARYGGLTASGGTPLLPAVFWAVDQLLRQPQQRKLLLVATDGEPVERESCKEAIRRCWLGDIEALGIGIQVPSVTDLFPLSVCIDDVSELAFALFDLLQSALAPRQCA